MEVLFILIGISLCVAVVFLGAFIWAIKTDQYEDEYGDSIRMLYEDQPKAASSSPKQKSEPQPSIK